MGGGGDINIQTIVRGAAILNRIDKEGLSLKVTFEQRSGEWERARCLCQEAASRIPVHAEALRQEWGV